ncbi:hypothetical protein DL96DRAFT_1756488 [Flagelloscypha sp. PMI_526]|nr:hypothetical protein DL96DRAFT_1756488 [Flagelloscypha sp. PMI_526]
MAVTEELLPVALTFMLYGSFLISAAFALYTLCQRPVKTRETWALLAVILSMVVLSTVGAGFQYTQQFYILGDKIASGQQTHVLEDKAYGSTSGRICGPGSESIYRRFGFAACLVGTAVLLAIIQRILVVFEKTMPETTFYYVYWFLLLLGCVILLISNLVTTTFMGSKVMKHSRQLDRSNLRQSGSRGLSVLLLLIECGALYALFQSLNLINLIMVATSSEPSENFDAARGTSKLPLSFTIFSIIVDSTFMMLSANITTLTIALTALSKKVSEGQTIPFESTAQLTSIGEYKRGQASV